MKKKEIKLLRRLEEKKTYECAFDWRMVVELGQLFPTESRSGNAPNPFFSRNFPPTFKHPTDCYYIHESCKERPKRSDLFQDLMQWWAGVVPNNNFITFQTNYTKWGEMEKKLDELWRANGRGAAARSTPPCATASSSSASFGGSPPPLRADSG